MGYFNKTFARNLKKVKELIINNRTNVLQITEQTYHKHPNKPATNDRINLP